MTAGEAAAICMVEYGEAMSRLEKLWDWSRSISRTKDWSAAGVETGERVWRASRWEFAVEVLLFLVKCWLV